MIIAVCFIFIEDMYFFLFLFLSRFLSLFVGQRVLPQTLIQHIIFLHKHTNTHKQNKHFHANTYDHSLKAHYRLHTGETPFQCKHCHRKFRLKYCLEVHLDAAVETKQKYQYILFNICVKKINQQTHMNL